MTMREYHLALKANLDNELELNENFFIHGKITKIEWLRGCRLCDKIRHSIMDKYINEGIN